MQRRARIVGYVGAIALLAGCGGSGEETSRVSSESAGVPATTETRTAQDCLKALGDRQRELAGADDSTRAQSYGYLPPGCETVGDDLPQTAQDRALDAKLAEMDAKVAAAERKAEAYEAEASRAETSAARGSASSSGRISWRPAETPREKACQKALYEGMKKGRDGRLSDDDKTTTSVRKACAGLDRPTMRDMYLAAADQRIADSFG